MVSKTVMSKWVNAAVSNDDIQFRQAVHIVLHALSSDKQTADAFILKGGILLALKFGSTRFTRDIDFSCISSYSEFSEIDFRAGLDKSLKRSILTVDYDLEMKIQKIEKKPNEKKIPNPRFPALKITIGYCKKGSLREGRTLSNVISIDISYNDYYNQESDLFSDEINLKCYSLQEVMAEKIRSVLQQVERNRSRRQDIYDLNYMINNFCQKTEQEKNEVFQMLIDKSTGKGIENYLNRNGLEDPEIKESSKKNYKTLESEVPGQLPDFEASYANVNQYFQSLPWPC